MNRGRSSLELVAVFVGAVGVGGAVLLNAVSGSPNPLAVGVLVATLPGAALFGASFVESEQVHRRLATLGLAVGTAVLVAVVVQVVIFVGVDGRPNDATRRLLGFAILGAVVAALAAPPIRRFLADAIRRRTAAAPTSSGELIARVERGLANDTRLDEVIIQAAEGIRQTHATTLVEIWTGLPEHLELAAALPPRQADPQSVPEPTASLAARAPVAGRSWADVLLPDLVAALPIEDGDDVAVAPLSASGSLCGLVVVARPAPFDDTDRRALEELAGRLAPAVDNARLGARLDESLQHLRWQAAELQASRTRLVSAGDEARQRIERDLHDGVQQQLVAVSLNLGLAERMLADGRTGEAAELLEELNRETTSLASALRSLAHGIYPPLLRDEGLTRAIEALAARTPGATMRGRCDRQHQSVESTVYFCCAEAVQNAQKHAAGSDITIDLDQRADTICFEVNDAGGGFDATEDRKGLGIFHMEDRIGALGGRLTIESGPDGTAVRGVIPLALVSSTVRRGR